MRSTGIFFFLVLLLTVAAPPAAAQPGSWTAEYFSNVDLAGNPAVVRTEVRPRGSWGEGSPHRGVPADHFSVRWSTTVLLEEDSYQLSAQADDGIRVLLNGETVIDEWPAADGDFFQRDLPLAAGEYRVVVEYLEQQGRAHVIFNMDPLLPPPPDDAARARITARFLNMRNESGLHGDIVKLVTMNQVLPVIGRNSLTTWLELAFGDLHAWVNASYVEAQNLGNVPITDGSPVPVSSVTATVTAATLNVREMPARNSRRLLRIREGERYPVLGRSLDEEWLWLNVEGINGWSHSDWLDVQPGLETVPVLNEDAVLSDATVTTDYLNVRDEPSLEGRIQQIIVQGEVFAVIGRNADASWIHLNVNGIPGWVFAAWTNVLPDLAAVPIIDDSREATPEDEAEDSEDGSDGEASDGQEATPAAST